VNARAGEDGASSAAVATAPAAARYARRLPLLLITAGVVVNLVSPLEYTVLALFAAAPLVAAPVSSGRRTAAVGAVALCALAVLTVFYDGDPLGPSLTRIADMAAVALIALGINRLSRRRSALLASARGVAEAAQRALLPMPPSRIGGLDVAARYEAAHADARIGGDLYAVQETPFGVRLIVGDVRGKGLEAVGTVAVLLGAFREAAEDEVSLEGVAARLDRALNREAARDGDPERIEDFTTAVVAEVPAGTPDRVRLVNRGHPPPLMLGGGTARFCEPTAATPPLGVGLGDWPDRADVVDFPFGAQLLLYTDGLSEARDGNGVFYPPDRRLAGRRFGTAEELLDALVADVAAYAGGGAADDMALLAVQRRTGT
jgi:serine phosphatase RsbU (regulator of sigma subunit)